MFVCNEKLLFFIIILFIVIIMDIVAAICLFFPRCEDISLFRFRFGILDGDFMPPFVAEVEEIIKDLPFFQLE